MDFPPILILVILWLLIGVAGRMKQAKQQGSQASKNTAQKAGGRQQKAKQPAAKAPAEPKPAFEPARPAVMQPTITVTEHDDSVYMGSLNAETGEGYDPCHDEQLAPLTQAETIMPAAEAEVPGLQLGWTGDEIVRGFVMSEILRRK